MARRDSNNRRVPRGALTEDELRATGERAGSGFTTRTTGPGAGRPARNVLSTGYAPRRGRGAEVALSPDMEAWEQIGKFTTEKSKILGSPGASMAVGGWQDPATGIVGMDTSVLTPKTVEGMIAAAQTAALGGQEAIGNIGPGTAAERAAMGAEDKAYLGDITLPKHLHQTQFSGTAHPRTSPVFEVSSSGSVSPTNRVIIHPSLIDDAEDWAKDEAARLGYQSEPGMGAQEYLDKYAGVPYPD